MSYSKPNASPATMSRNRVSPAPQSGICATCLDGCPGPCEVGRSALRGREILYPQPFAKVTAGAEKDYPVDLSHFNIQGSCVGAMGVTVDPDRATFPAVDISTTVGAKEKIRMKVPYFTGARDSQILPAFIGNPWPLPPPLPVPWWWSGKMSAAWIRKRKFGTGRWSNLRSWSDE